MEERVLNWIEEHVREKGFTDEEHTLILVAEVRRLQEALSLKTLAHEVDTDIQEEQLGESSHEAAVWFRERAVALGEVERLATAIQAVIALAEGPLAESSNTDVTMLLKLKAALAAG